MQPMELVPQFYAAAWLMDNERKAAEKSLNAGIDQFVEEFVAKLDTMEDALGIRRQKDPEKRLIGYLMKPEILWQEQAAKFPWDFEHDWEDYQELRGRAERGEFGDR